MKIKKILVVVSALGILVGCGGGSSKSQNVNSSNSNQSNTTNVNTSGTNNIDNHVPTITLKGDNPISLELGQTFQDPGVETSDNSNEEMKVTVNGSVDTFTIGDYTLTYTAKDTSGNEASVTRVVKVTDALVSAEGVDIAHKYAKATQGTKASYYYYKPASYAIDNNDSTNNHTSGGKHGENWLQIELPHPIKISKIVLQNANGNTYRLTNAKVYISDIPYAGTVDESNLVKTLEATNNEQIINFDTPKSGSYLLIKGEQREEDDRHIHLRKVEVYGALPLAPSFTTTKRYFLISINSKIGKKVTTVNAIDYQTNSVSYGIIGSVPFEIDAQGNISVKSKLQGGIYNFEVEVSDGTYKRREPMAIEVTSKNAIEELLKSGDVIHSKVTEDELIQATLDEIKSLRAGDSLLKGLYDNEAISYDPTNRSQIINITGDAHKIFSILQGNNGKNLAVAGVKNKSRFAAFGAAPMEQFENGNNLSYEPQFKHLLSWLINNDVNDALSTKKTIGLSFVYADKSDIKTWLRANYPNWTIQECDRSTPNFSTCYNNVDLIITGWQTDEANTEVIRKRLEAETMRGTPILYLHTWYEAYNSVAQSIAELFEFQFSHGGNYWAKDKAEWGSVQSMQTSAFSNLGYESVEKMFKHFKANDYAFDWNVCKDGDKVGSQYDDCSDVVALNSEFQEGATEARNSINALDYAKKNIFKESGYRFQKLLALTADKFRQSVHYPMDKVTTDDNEFMKSYYADHVVYNFRKINPVQADMGNFSSSDFSAITPITRVLNIQSKRKFKATGAYALPGQTVKVTRSDSSDLSVKVFINSLRSGATHQYQKNAYNRPKYLQTPHFEIKSGESIELTSPYGGPIQLEFSKNDLPVNITFENVGEHPFWESSADNASFTEKLNAGNYNWAEIATAGFTVHSKLDKMRQSIADARWGGTAEGLANAVVQYTSNYPHVLAGFKGEGVDVVPEIHDWAEEKGLTIETIDIMKHMNADQATCGYGCSGNPYDAYWAFNPIGHGDIHEMGHSMQMMRFEGFPNHAATNTFSYYTKLRYFENTGEYGDCQGLPFKKLFDTVQSSVGESNVEAYLKINLWDRAGLGEQYLLKIEAMMHSQKLGKVQKGWHVLARVHILEREMRRAKKDWEARKASVGFSTYSLDEIKAIPNNDWLTIAYSYASELDLRDYFDMMGMPYSQKAHDQIASFGFDKAPKSLFVSTDTGYCKSDEYGTLFDRPTLSIDGNTSYAY